MDPNKALLRFVGSSDGTECIGTLCDICKHHGAKYSSFGEHPDLCPLHSAQTCHNHIPSYFFVKRNASSVVVFARKRVPFELPKTNGDALSELKNDLIQAIKELEWQDNSALCARYGATQTANTSFDVENVLFYNVGTKHFHSLTKQRIIFEAVPPAEIIAMQKQWAIPDLYSHYYEYTIHPSSTILPPTGELLAEWNSIPFCKCSGLTPALCWKTVKASAEKFIVYDRIDCEKKDHFSLLLKIEKPSNVNIRIASAMKPLLDGLICAFHSSSFDQHELTYFANKLCCDDALLKSDRLNILGNRKCKYIQGYPNNVKWNPADDLCRHVDISITSGNEWKLSGKIFKAE